MSKRKIFIEENKHFGTIHICSYAGLSGALAPAGLSYSESEATRTEAVSQSSETTMALIISVVFPGPDGVGDAP